MLAKDSSTRNQLRVLPAVRFWVDLEIVESVTFLLASVCSWSLFQKDVSPFALSRLGGLKEFWRYDRC